MLTEQPHRLTNRMLPAVRNRDLAEDLSDEQACSLPEQSVTDTETREALAALIAELPAGFAAVFVARVIDEQPTAAVATALGISEDLVRWRLRRARMLLRERIDADVA